MDSGNGSKVTPAGPTTNPSTATLFKMRHGAPLFSNTKGDISFDDWVSALESHFATADLRSEKAKMDEARNCVNYKVGDAREVVENKEFKTWEEMKEFFRAFCAIHPPNMVNDLSRLYSLRWKKGESLLTYGNGLFALLKRVLSHSKAVPMHAALLTYMETMVITQLPDKLRKIREDKDLVVKTNEDWQNFMKSVQLELRREQSLDTGMVHAVPASTTGTKKPKHGTNQTSKPTNKPGKSGPSAYELKTGKCGRCLEKGHFRFQCTASSAKCNYCGEAHDFFECPTRPRKDSKQKSQNFQ